MWDDGDYENPDDYEEQPDDTDEQNNRDQSDIAHANDVRFGCCSDYGE